MTDAAILVGAAEQLSSIALQALRKLTGDGRNSDEHQVALERVAYAATEARAARALLDMLGSGGGASKLPDGYALAAAGELAKGAYDRIAPIVDELGIGEAALEQTHPATVRAALRRALAIAPLRELGRKLAEQDGKVFPKLDETYEEVRRSVRTFAESQIGPHAEHIHRHDELVPDSIIDQMAQLGYFGLSVPGQYGGYEMGNLAMILTTEELSRVSLPNGGSLITRPEILSKALLAGGTQEQKAKWLPRIASGELMVGISVTEPNVGSDVASLQCRATAGELDGQQGWFLDGAKAWCTFAGRANILALLARTDPDASKGAKGLSLFIVEKERFDGHKFEMKQPYGGTLTGTADRTIGYRGMHSFSMTLERFFVPAENLVGGAQGAGRGFYLQMAGFAAGRLQTGGRACGVAQAAIETTCKYVNERRQFGQATINYPLTQHMLGRMAVRLAAARAITYAAALAMDADERAASLIAAQAKLFSCDIAVEITQQGQLLHGGWGYAEEYAISRYVVDALVLPIFEGVKPILALKVVGRALLAGE